MNSALVSLFCVRLIYFACVAQQCGLQH